MKKRILCLVAVLVLCLTVGLTSCNKEDKTIYVCASELPHADILENAVAPILKEKGYTLKVTVLDWTIQNDSVANKDYDANYFQHIPYLETYTGAVKLFASAKVHYEPLGIYKGKESTDLETGLISVAICNDESNAIRALELLAAKGFINGDLPISEDGKLTFTYITKDDEEKVGAGTNDHDGIVEMGRDIEGVEVSIFLRETDNGYKISLRSNEYVNVSDICLMFGGGGHVRAAGGNINLPFEQAKEKIIEECKKHLR